MKSGDFNLNGCILIPVYIVTELINFISIINVFMSSISDSNVFLLLLACCSNLTCIAIRNVVTESTSLIDEFMSFAIWLFG